MYGKENIDLKSIFGGSENKCGISLAVKNFKMKKLIFPESGNYSTEKI